MIKKIKELVGNFFIFRKYPIIKEFIKFCLVGLSNLAIDIFVYWALTRFLKFYYLLAAVLSFLVAVSWSFYINRRWTFRHYLSADLSKQYLKFFTANLISLFCNLLLLYVFVDLVGIHDLLAKLVASIIIAFLNFSLNKFWTFRSL